MIVTKNKRSLNSSQFTVEEIKCDDAKKPKQDSQPEKIPEPKVEKVQNVENESKQQSTDPKPEAESKSNDTEEKTKTGRVRNRKRQKLGFYDRVAKKRMDEGKIILSQKIETKIYKLKKALQKKGVEDAEVRDIIRKRRREEELKFRKEQKTVCFKCRKPGHALVDCPEAAKSRDESHDICYFCGSAEHKLHECVKYRQTGKKNVKLPYVKCFICGKQGHLTRDCSDNENGAFPRGGKCILCSSVNHLVKDCSRNTEKADEIEINLATYDSVGQGGVDADDFNFELSTTASTKPTSTATKAKVVTF